MWDYRPPIHETLKYAWQTFYLCFCSEKFDLEDLRTSPVLPSALLLSTGHCWVQRSWVINSSQLFSSGTYNKCCYTAYSTDFIAPIYSEKPSVSRARTERERETETEREKEYLYLNHERSIRGQDVDELTQNLPILHRGHIVHRAVGLTQQWVGPAYVHLVEKNRHITVSPQPQQIDSVSSWQWKKKKARVRAPILHPFTLISNYLHVQPATHIQ